MVKFTNHYQTLIDVNIYYGKNKNPTNKLFFKFFPIGNFGIYDNENQIGFIDTLENKININFNVYDLIKHQFGIYFIINPENNQPFCIINIIKKFIHIP